MKHLIIEDPAGMAVVDFLPCPSHRGTQVTLEVADGRLQIRVSVAHGENAYTWDEHEYEIDIAPILILEYAHAQPQAQDCS